MKKLSDYKGEDSILLWGRILKPLMHIFTDDKIKTMQSTAGTPYMDIALEAMNSYATEIAQIIAAVDDSELNGENILPRFFGLINEIIQAEELRSFFGFSGQAMKPKESTGPVTENIKDGEN